MTSQNKSQQATDHLALALQLIADDRDVISYRRQLNAVTGSVHATILFQQSLFHWKNNRRSAFYKFMAPADSANKFYRQGDSWTEELGFSRYEFETARELIGIKIKRGTGCPDTHPIAYWRDGNNLTWYIVNEGVAARWIEQAYNPNVVTPHPLPPTGCNPRPIVMNPHSRMLQYHIRWNAGIPHSMKWGDTTFPITEKEINRETSEKKTLPEINGKNPHTVWELAYGQLQHEMPREAFDTWLKGAKLVDHDNGVFTLGVPNTYAREWLEHRLKKVITRALTHMAGQAVQVEFVLWNQHNEV